MTSEEEKVSRCVFIIIRKIITAIELKKKEHHTREVKSFDENEMEQFR